MKVGSLVTWKHSPYIGIVIENDDGFVTELDGSNLGLTGYIPLEIGKLKELQALYLAHNDLKRSTQWDRGGFRVK